MMYTESYPPASWCNAAYTRPSPIDALTFSPWAINATMAVIPRANESAAEKAFYDCCVSSDVDIVDQCWALCEILAPPASDSDSRFSTVSGPRPDDLSLASRGLAEDGVKAFESCMTGKGVDMRGMNPKAEYRVVGSDGKLKPLQSGAASVGRGLSMTGLGLVGLVCLGLMI